MKGQRFDAEFKKDIVKLYLSGTRTCPSLAAELGMHISSPECSETV